MRQQLIYAHFVLISISSADAELLDFLWFPHGAEEQGRTDYFLTPYQRDFSKSHAGHLPISDKDIAAIDKIRKECMYAEEKDDDNFFSRFYPLFCWR